MTIAGIQEESASSPEQEGAPVRVFISYSREDLQLLNSFLKHLAPLVDQGVIAPWYDKRIEPGMEWDRELRAQLEAAQIIVLLVSAPFLYSRYIKEVELKRALERHDAGSARVVPVILRPTYLEGSRLDDLQALPNEKQPVTCFPAPQDAAWMQVVEGLALLAKSLRREPASGVKARELPATVVSAASALRVPSTGDWKEFAAALRGRLDLINDEHDWSERHFSDLAAEVEAEDGPDGGNRRLRRQPSLQAAIEKSQSKIALVEGESGSGKSVSFRHLATTLVARAASAPESYPLLPLYVNLNELEAADPTQVQPEEIRDYIRARLSALGNEAKRFLDAHFDWALKEGRWLLLLDSFDEIPAVLSSAQPDLMVRSHARAIHDFAWSGLHRSRVIVASRPYRGPGHMPWSRFRILPLGEERRKHIVRGWFNDAEADRVLAELIDGPGLGEWVDNPLLLSLICAHRHAAGALPESARDAFESLVQRRIQAHADVLERHRISAEALRSGSERIAFHMTEDLATGMLPSRESLRRMLWTRARQTEAETDAVLDCLIDMKLGRGATTLGKQDGFGFFHRRLQEFFATCHVLNGAQAEGHLTATALLRDERWRETVVTLLQIGAPDQLRPILVEAQRILELGADAVSGADAEVFETLRADWAAIDRLRAQGIPAEFPWPDGALHLLGVLGCIRRGANAEHPALHETLASARQQADRLLLAAGTRGLRLDQAWAVESAAAASPSFRSALLSWAFASRSGWLEDIAFRQASRVEVLPPAMEAGIRRALIGRHLSGDLRREPTRLATQVRRVDPAGKFVNALRLLRIVGPVDGCLLGIVWLFVPVSQWWAHASVEVLAASILGGSTMAILSYWVCSFYARMMRRAKPRAALLRAQADLAPQPPAAGLRQRARATVRRGQAWPNEIYDWFSMVAPAVLRLYALVLVAKLCGIELRLSSPRGMVALGACYATTLRPGAYLALSLGYSVQPALWPLLGLSPIWAFWRAFRRHWRSALLAALLIALSVALAVAVIPLAVGGAIDARAIRRLAPFIAGAVYGGAALLLGSLLILDWGHGRKLRGRTEAIELQQLLRDAAAFHFRGHRAAFLRWVREQGKLEPTAGGEQLLRDLLLAIEQDYARRRSMGLRAPVKKLADGVAWTQPFRDWYEEAASPRKGLSSWHGETLDELSRLLEQLSQRVRAAEVAGGATRSFHGGMLQ